MTWAKNETLKLGTLSLHAGQQPDSDFGSRAVPIYQSTSYVFGNVDHAASLFNLERAGHIYSRISNPTVSVLEERLAALEEGVGAICTASGMAALHLAISTLMDSGSHIVASKNIYGGCYNLFKHTLPRFGIETSFVDARAIDQFEASIQPNTRLVFGETLGNPGLEVLDIPRLAKIAHSAGIPLMIDNTFATPYLQQPLSLGADVVVHSATKYLGGHSDVVGGFVATNHEALAEDLVYIQNAVGAVPSPFDCYLAMRGVKTLAVRMDRHCDNAQRIVALLQAHDAVSQVLYPGLPEHPGHDIASKQMKNFGGMVSFRLEGGQPAAEKLVTSTRIFTLAESLGAVESLIEHPGVMTHLSVAGSALEVPDDLVRISVGIESIDDLVSDLTQALDQLA